MNNDNSRVTVHMVASLDGFIARKDGSVDWMETADEFPGGESMDPEFVEAFLADIDCYVLGARSYESALEFERKGLGWSYEDKPVFVLSNKELDKTRETVTFFAGETETLVEQLRGTYRNIWIVGGTAVCSDTIGRGLVDEIYYAILPVLLGDGLSFFSELPETDIALHLMEAKAYTSGMVELRYAIRREPE